MVTKKHVLSLLALALTACGGGVSVTSDGALCTVPITTQPSDYTIDADGQWLYMPDTGDEVRILEECI